ncbi:hypothetical protein ATANTOWER_022224 [Ataeniobius toweri]|uniref:Uncharacterized protein n=1 Tax=Ataeniobius toweri TaxID=208326 RepID=A0ABU7C9H0_9TELE|nr:hypothetical protein [Ataeniobius toweri]
MWQILCARQITCGRYYVPPHRPLQSLSSSMGLCLSHSSLPQLCVPNIIAWVIHKDLRIFIATAMELIVNSYNMLHGLHGKISPYFDSPQLSQNGNRGGCSNGI